MDEVLLESDGVADWVIRWQADEVHLEFRVWSAIVCADGTVEVNDEAADVHPTPTADRDGAEPMMTGRLKWDGCIDIDFPSLSKGMLHFCGPEEDPALGRILRAVYALGPKIEGWDF